MLKKIDQIQALLNVPNVDADTETAIANMKILNLLVDLRAQAEQLNLSSVSQQSELLTGFVRFERKQDYKYKLSPLSEKIKKYQASL